MFAEIDFGDSDNTTFPCMSMILMKSIVLEPERYIIPFVGFGATLNEGIEISGKPI